MGPFIGIAFLNFLAFEDEPCIFEVSERFEGSAKRMSDHWTMTVIQLPKFNKKIEELEDDFDLYLYLLVNMGSFNEIPTKFDNEKFRPLFERARIANLNLKEMRESIAREKQEEMFSLRIGGAKAIGREEGREQGRDEERRGIIRNMFINSMMSSEEIARIVNMPVEFVEKVVGSLDENNLAV